MNLKGKKVIALGDRDSVPGEVIAAIAEAAGAAVVAQRTECFV
jgi:glycine/sarcosine/betaine reductase complex component A